MHLQVYCSSSLPLPPEGCQALIGKEFLPSDLEDLAGSGVEEYWNHQLSIKQVMRSASQNILQVITVAIFLLSLPTTQSYLGGFCGVTCSTHYRKSFFAVTGDNMRTSDGVALRVTCFKLSSWASIVPCIKWMPSEIGDAFVHMTGACWRESSLPSLLGERSHITLTGVLTRFPHGRRIAICVS